MPVEEDINLDNPDGLTQEDIRLLEEKADELEKIAEKAENAKKKIEDASEPLRGLNFSQLNIMESALADVDTKTTAGKVSELSKEDMVEIIRGLMEQQEDHKKQIDENKKQIDSATKERMELMKKIRSIEGGLQDGLSNYAQLTGNPKGFLRGKGFKMLGKIGIAGAVASFAINFAEDMYNEIISEVKGWYGEGGSHDIRKDVLNHMLQTANLQHMIAVERGEVFFTSDTAEIIRQGVPQTSNTRERVNGHKQYLQEFDR